MSKEEQRKKYYAATKDRPGSFLLKQALEFVEKKGKALDLGAGALQDTKFILKNGFERVVVVDKSPLIKEYTQDLEQKELEKIDIHITPFEEYIFPPHAFDLINAQWALPFCNPQEFSKVFKSLIESLDKGGVFTGQLFGINDEWNQDGNGRKEGMTFHTRNEVASLLHELEIMKLLEKEEDSTTTLGVPKHWHVFHIIAKN